MFAPAGVSIRPRIISTATIVATGPAGQVDAMIASTNGTESPQINVSGAGNRGASIRTSR